MWMILVGIVVLMSQQWSCLAVGIPNNEITEVSIPETTKRISVINSTIDVESNSTSWRFGRHYFFLGKSALRNTIRYSFTGSAHGTLASGVCFCQSEVKVFRQREGEKINPVCESNFIGWRLSRVSQHNQDFHCVEICLFFDDPAIYSDVGAQLPLGSIGGHTNGPCGGETGDNVGAQGQEHQDHTEAANPALDSSGFSSLFGRLCHAPLSAKVGLVMILGLFAVGGIETGWLGFLVGGLWDDYHGNWRPSGRGCALLILLGRASLCAGLGSAFLFGSCRA